MKVGLFAPYHRPESGGTWQFAQWIISQVGPHVPMHLILPDEMLDELFAHGSIPAGITASSPKTVRAELRRRLSYRLLELPVRSGLVGAERSFYVRALGRLQRLLSGGTMESWAQLPQIKANNVDVLHVPLQYLSDEILGRKYPYVINPHDYQHEHFPQFFTLQERSRRRNRWYASQRAADAIVVHSLQTRDDALRYLKVPEERVFYAPYGPLATFPDVDDSVSQRIKEELGLPDRFIFYPSKMWRHKNHIALLEALQHLKRKRALELNCVFTDAAEVHGREVLAAIERMELATQVKVVGRVSPEAMGALYKLSTMVVVPSLFEQNSGPMLEALHFGKAIAVSNLPELAHSLGGAGLVFDPRSTKAIADTIDEVFSSPERQAELENRAASRSGELSWEPFVQTYRAAYAFAAARR